MEFWGLLAVVFVLTLIVGAICGLVAVGRTGRLEREIAAARLEIQNLSQRLERQRFEQTQPEETSDPVPDSTELVEPLREARSDRAQTPPVVHATPVTPESSSLRPGRLLEVIRANWMTWLGGGCVSLAGIFLVRYSMEQGWLGPIARVVAAIAVGLACQLTAEVLRRRDGMAQPAVSALAGAGSITIYGALFAALKLYGLLSPTLTFVLMAAVAIATMALAVLHGPVLAAFGILGAYLVPILVGSADGDIRLALIYALIISLSALLLMRYVYRPWLWWGFVAGAMGWWALALGTPDADGFRTLYLTALAYLMAAAPVGDWSLRERFALDYDGYDPRKLECSMSSAQIMVLATYLLLTIAIVPSISAFGTVLLPWTQGLPLFALVTWIAARRDALFVMPWLIFVASVAGWLWVYTGAPNGGVPQPEFAASATTQFLIYLFVYALIASVSSVLHFGTGKRAAVWASLATLAPIIMFALAYAVELRPATDSFWALVTAVFSFAYLAVAGAVLQKRSVDAMVVWLFIAGHLGLGLAAVMAFESATLTLAIAAQLVSLAWVIRRFQLPDLGWLFKLAVLVIIARLTLNPWLIDYGSDWHWSLWTYGGATAFAAFAAYWLRPHAELSRWAEGAALHLFVLTAWSELRYQLNDGVVYSSQFSFVEAVLSMLLAAALGLVYRYRARFSQTLGKVYLGYAFLLVGAAVLLYGVILLNMLGSERWLWASVGTTPVLNILLAAFGLPVVMAALYAYHFLPSWRARALQFAGVSLFIFLSVEVRHLWTGTIRLNQPPVSEAELYTYSAVWLLMALTGLLAGSWRRNQSLYVAGLVVLALVIGKLFLVDLAGLEGLFRVASFMGLGLSLLGLAYLHQRLARTGSRDFT